MYSLALVALTILIGLPIVPAGRAIPASQQARRATRSPRPAAAADPFHSMVVHLPPADRVEITTIAGFRRPGEARFTPKRATLVGEDALAVARVWRRLRKGVPVQCYNPGYQVTFFAKDIVLVRADVCFDCRKIQIQGEDHEDISGNRKAVAELLKVFKRATGD